MGWPQWASFECPFCLQQTGDGKFTISAHLSAHMEEISLAALPVGVDEEHKSSSDSESTISQQHRADDDSKSLSDDEHSPSPLIFFQNFSKLYKPANGFVDTGNNTGCHLISDDLVVGLGFKESDFGPVVVESVDTTAGTIHPTGTISLTWHIEIHQALEAEIDKAHADFHIVPESILSTYFAPYNVVFSASGRRLGRGTRNQKLLIKDVVHLASRNQGALIAPFKSHHVILTNTELFCLSPRVDMSSLQAELDEQRQANDRARRLKEVQAPELTKRFSSDGGDRQVNMQIVDPGAEGGQDISSYNEASDSDSPRDLFVCPYEPCVEKKPRTWVHADEFRSHLYRRHKLRFEPEDSLDIYLHQYVESTPSIPSTPS